MKKGDNGSSLEVKKGEDGSSFEDAHEQTRTNDSHVQGTCMYNSRNAQEILKCFFLSMHACFPLEEIDLWKKQSKMKDRDLSRTQEELCVAHTELMRKEGTCNNESTTSVVCVFK